MKIRGYELRELRKAIVGGLAGSVPLFAVDIADLHLTRVEGGALIGAFVVGAFAVFGIKNAPAAKADPAPGQD